MDYKNNGVHVTFLKMKLIELCSKLALILTAYFLIFACTGNAMPTCTPDQIYNPQHKRVDQPDFKGYVIEACWDNRVARWRLEDGSSITKHKRNQPMVPSQDGGLLALTLIDRPNNEILIFDRETDKITKIQAKEPYVKISHPSFSPDKRQLAFTATPYTHGGVGEILVVDLETGKEIKRIKRLDGSYGPYTHVTFGCGGQCLFYGKHMAAPNNTWLKSSPILLNAYRTWGIFHYDLVTDQEQQVGKEVFSSIHDLIADKKNGVYVYASSLLLPRKAKHGQTAYVSARRYSRLEFKDNSMDGTNMSHLGQPYESRYLLKAEQSEDGKYAELVNFTKDLVIDRTTDLNSEIKKKFLYSKIDGVTDQGKLIVWGKFANEPKKHNKTNRLSYFTMNDKRVEKEFPFPKAMIAHNFTMISVIGGDPHLMIAYINVEYYAGKREIGWFDKGTLVQDVNMTDEWIERHIEGVIEVGYHHGNDN